MRVPMWALKSVIPLVVTAIEADDGQNSSACFFLPFPELRAIHHHHHLSLNCEGRWGTTDDFATSFLHFPLFSTALWDLAKSRPVHSLLSSHLFLCLPCLLSPFTVPCDIILARPDDRETWPYHCSLRLFTMIRSWFCGSVKVEFAASSTDFCGNVVLFTATCSDHRVEWPGNVRRIFFFFNLLSRLSDWSLHFCDLVHCVLICY